jgi:chromosome partitioning protein
MEIIAAVNNKGGVGKTKLTELLVEYIARYTKKRILAIDFDPQCNFSQRFLKMEIDSSSPEGVMPPVSDDYDPNDPDNASWDGRSSIADIFFSKGVYPYPTHLENLDIAPGHAANLLAAESVRKTEVVERVHNRLFEFLQLPEVQEEYDVVLIDTAPSKGHLTTAVIKCATHIIIPSAMETQPVQGIYGMVQLWMQESLRREKSRPLKLVGILPNMYRNVALHKGIFHSLQQDELIGKYILPVKLGDRIAFAEVDSDGARPRSIFDLPNGNEAKKEAEEVCKYLVTEIFK